MSARREIAAVVLGSSASAVRLRVDGRDDWLPLSQLDDAGRRAVAQAKPGEAVTLHIPRWALAERGWGAPAAQRRLPL